MSEPERKRPWILDPDQRRDVLARAARYSRAALIGLASFPVWTVFLGAVVYAGGQWGGGVLFFVGPPLALLGMMGVAWLAHRRGHMRVLAGVLVVDALVSGLLWPYYQQATLRKVDVCAANLGNIASALKLYADESQNELPARLGQLTPRYLQAIPTCPAAGSDTYSASYQPGAGRYTLFCKGENHVGEGVEKDSPSATF